MINSEERKKRERPLEGEKRKEFLLLFSAWEGKKGGDGSIKKKGRKGTTFSTFSERKEVGGKGLFSSSGGKSKARGGEERSPPMGRRGKKGKRAFHSLL